MWLLLSPGKIGFFCLTNPLSQSASCFSLSPSLARSLSLTHSLSLCVRVCVSVCMYVCEGNRQSIPFCQARPLLIGDIHLACLSSNTNTDLDQWWLQAGAQMTEAEGGWEGLEESFDGLGNATTSIMSLIKRAPGSPSLRGLLASSLALCLHNWANCTLIWPPARLGRGWKSPRHENAVVVDITVWFLECLWRTAVHNGEQRSYVGQLVSAGGNHLLSFACSFDP